MDLNPPAGSKISVIDEDGNSKVIIPAASGVGRYFTGAFMLFWLGMWTVGFRDVSSKILSGNFQPFLVLWLGAWTLGGVFAAYTAFRAFRPSVPETLTLKRNSIAYDSGITPPQFNTYGRYQSRKDVWKQAFPKRVRVEIERKQLQSLRLRETDTGNRLTIDVDAARLDLAPAASEVDREWLAGVLARRYSLAQVSGNPPDSP